MIEVREMKAQHAEDVSVLVCRSIRELCTSDHHNDSVIIAKWVSNKTPNHILELLDASETTILVAFIGNDIAGVGAFGITGEILLNYVSPDYRSQGISENLLSAMEGYLLNDGVSKAILYSNETALCFYKKQGWVRFGVVDIKFGVTG